MARIPLGARAIVVDNGSVDGSADIARDLGAEVVYCPARGYGAACHAGLLAASADLIAFCDCDGSLDPGAALPMAERVIAGADLVVSRRCPTGRAAWSLAARLANRELARRVHRRTGVALDDVGPLRVASRVGLLSLGLTDRRSGYPVETIVAAARAGWHIEQFDVDYTPRIGRSKVSGTLRGSLQAVRDMSGVLAQ
ncbi:MAG: glycosyltransferase family 2 protein [Actinomycetota bacterium]|nr:glycosyltransferase family 2 protein [Actinomycetota bacterium]